MPYKLTYNLNLNLPKLVKTPIFWGFFLIL
jgi:hypothetical protein